MQKDKAPHAHLYDYTSPPERDAVRGKRKRGRPKGALNEKTIWKKMLSAKHVSKETGETRTVFELLILTLKKLVAEGDLRAIAIFEQFFGVIYEEPDPAKGGCEVLLAPADMGAEEWIAKMEEKNRQIDRIRREVMQEMALNNPVFHMK